MSLSLGHILVVVVLVMILFGAGRIPRIMEDLAKGIKSFKKGMADDDAPQKRIDDKRE